MASNLAEGGRVEPARTRPSNLQRLKRAVAAAGLIALVGAVSAWSSPHRSTDGIRYRTGTVMPSGPHRPGAWCGTSASATDRLPDVALGQQLHVIYAFPSDATDNSAARAPAIVADLTTIDTWWRGQDPTRRPRFDLFAFPGCLEDLSRLDLSIVRLPHDSAFYAVDGSSAINRLSTDLTAPPSSLGDSQKKYIVYFDGPVQDNRLCGIAFTTPNLTGRLGYAVAFLASLCGGDLGAGGLAADTVAHEMTHDLGALPRPGPPHACPGNEGHVCDGQFDLMYPFVQPLGRAILDINRDDYYAHSGTWWDVQDSSFLEHVGGSPLALTVALEGDADAGTVASSVPGISCPSACSATYDTGAAVTLEATPAGNARFAGWGGACTGTDECTITMDSAKTVTARFVRIVAVHVSVVRNGGGGAVRSSTGETCATTCDFDVDRGTPVRLTAVASRNSRFTGWTGACSGRGACRISPGSNAAVGATFGPSTYRIAAAVVGRGSLTSTPAGIACPRTCVSSFPAGSPVRIRATAKAGWKFLTWRGDCHGRLPCTVKADRAHAVRAVFTKT
jgi:hypothetical protein